MVQRWKFGAGQAAKVELAEIREAQRSGRAEAYIAGQRWRDMIEAETLRRRAAKAARRAAA